MPINLKDRMRAGTVKRWHIVATHRDQTLAEHHYRVWVIADELYRKVAGAHYSESVHHEVQGWALAHDEPEILMGDVPTPTKHLLEAVVSDPGDRSIFRDIETKLCPAWASTERAIRNTPSAYIVKLADLMEAAYFLHEEGYGDHAARVKNQILHRFFDLIGLVKGKFQTSDYNWTKVIEVWTELISGEDNAL